MSIPFTCPHCGHFTQVDDRFAGQSGPCGKCGQKVVIPLAAPTAPAMAWSPPAAKAPPAAPSLAAPNYASTPGFAAAPRPRGGGGKTVLTVLAVVGGVLLVLCGGFAALGYWIFSSAIEQARGAADRAASHNNLRQIGLALHNYHDTYNGFPPAYSVDSQGRPLLSWRTMILPFVEENYLFDQVARDQAWDSPANRALHARRPSIYASPRAPLDDGQSSHYVAIRGPNTIFADERSTRIGQITDGTSNTILVVELLDSNIPWMKPDDLSLTETHRVLGGLVLMADGSTRQLDQNMAITALQHAATRDDGNVFDGGWTQ